MSPTLTNDWYGGACSPRERGMSPSNSAMGFAVSSVPRASGDEPVTGYRLRHVLRCSPRERG